MDCITCVSAMSDFVSVYDIVSLLFFIVLHLIENKFCGTVLILFLALHLPLGKTTVMHLVARENLPEPNNQGKPVNDISCVNVKYVNIKDKGHVNIANCIFKYQ